MCLSLQSDDDGEEDDDDADGQRYDDAMDMTEEEDQ